MYPALDAGFHEADEMLLLLSAHFSDEVIPIANCIDVLTSIECDLILWINWIAAKHDRVHLENLLAS